MPALVQSSPPSLPAPSHWWLPRVLALVASSEGNYCSVNANKDGKGVSFGLAQWTQHGGGLGELLARMHQHAPQTFASVFGGGWQELLKVTSASTPVERMKPVLLTPYRNPSLLWTAPWVERFKLAGKVPAFQQAQRDHFRTGLHFKAAWAVCQSLNLLTDRGLCLAMDVAIQDGPGRVHSYVQGVKQKTGYAARLTALAAASADRHRRTTSPCSACGANPECNCPVGRKGSWRWRKVGSEWHHLLLFGGQWVDMYQRIHSRRFGIVNHASLTDHPLSPA